MRASFIRLCVRKNIISSIDSASMLIISVHLEIANQKSVIYLEIANQKSVIYLEIGNRKSYIYLEFARRRELFSPQALVLPAPVCRESMPEERFFSR